MFVLISSISSLSARNWRNSHEEKVFPVEVVDPYLERIEEIKSSLNHSCLC